VLDSTVECRRIVLMVSFNVNTLSRGKRSLVDTYHSGGRKHEFYLRLITIFLRFSNISPPAEPAPCKPSPTGCFLLFPEVHGFRPFVGVSRSIRSMLSGLDTRPSHVVNSVSSSLRYSPISACRNVTTPVGSSFRASAVDLALTPNPSGVSFILSTMTP
jgi:hypothetical protein